MFGSFIIMANEKKKAPKQHPEEFGNVKCENGFKMWMENC